MNLELRSTVDTEQRELFLLMKQIELAKMHALRGYPYMQQFLNRTMSEDVSEALLAVEEKRSVLEETYEALGARIDYSRGRR